jgi:hypothetical protein
VVDKPIFYLIYCQWRQLLIVGCRDITKVLLGSPLVNNIITSLRLGRDLNESVIQVILRLIDTTFATMFAGS